MSPLRALLSPVLLLALTACGSDVPEPPASTDTSEAAAPAQRRAAPAGDLAADQDEISDYRLTMADLQRFVEAMQGLQALEAFNEEEMGYDEEDYDDESDADEDDDAVSGRDARTLDEWEEQYRSVPGAEEAIEDAGLDVRDFVVIQLAYLNTGMAAALVGMGSDPDSVMDALQVDPDNLQFWQENEEAITRLMESMGG